MRRQKRPDTLAPHLTALLQKPFTGCIGTGASRGQGWVEVQLEDPRPWRAGTTESRYRGYIGHCGEPVLAVTLLSDGLFRDDYLREKTAPTLADLEPLQSTQQTGREKPDSAFMDTRLVFGFDGEPILLPRAPRLAVSAGSVFLFKGEDRGSLDPQGRWCGMDRRGQSRRLWTGGAVASLPFAAGRSSDMSALLEAALRLGRGDAVRGPPTSSIARGCSIEWGLAISPRPR